MAFSVSTLREVADAVILQSYAASKMASSQPPTVLPATTSSQPSSSPDPQEPASHGYSNVDDYINLLRRIPTSHSNDQTTQTNADCPRYDHIVSLLIRQPPEIVGYILFWLDTTDLLNLRAASHTLHDLVHRCERAICLSFADRVLRDHCFSSPLRPADDLSHFFAKSRALDGVCKIAAFGANRISMCMKNRRFAEDKTALSEWRERKATRLRGRLKRSLLILQFYLDFFSDIIMTTDSHFRTFNDDEYSALHNIYDLDQQNFIEQQMSWLTEQDFIDVSCTLSILKGLCKRSSVAFPMKSPGYPFASVRSILIYEGLAPLSKLLPEVGFAKQTALLRQLSEKLVPRKKGKVVYSNKASPLPSIHHLNGLNHGLDDEIYHKRNSKIRERFVAHQDIWDKAARACMMRKLGRFPSTQPTNTWIQKIALEDDERTSDVTIGPWDSPEQS